MENKHIPVINSYIWKIEKKGVSLGAILKTNKQTNKHTLVDIMDSFLDQKKKKIPLWTAIIKQICTFG